MTSAMPFHMDAMLRAAVVACAAFLVAGGAQRASAVDPREATTSRQAKADAIASLPLDGLNPAERRHIESLVERASIYRRLPVTTIEGDPHLYLFLLENPHVISSTWKVMGISNVSLRPAGPGSFRAADGAGTLGTVHVLHADAQKHLIYAEGSYDGPLLARPVRARCVLFLRTGYTRQPDGSHTITSQLDVFIRLDSIGMDLLAKTFQPLIGRSADYNFTETMSFVGKFSSVAERNPAGIARLAKRLDGVDGTTRDRLVVVSHQLAERRPAATETNHPVRHDSSR